MARKKDAGVTIDDVHNETLALFHRLIQRLERLTSDCEDPGTINQALKTTADFLVKLNKGRNRIVKCKGIVAEVHPNVFVVEVAGEIFDRISCSYVDMICGEVALTEQSAT